MKKNFLCSLCITASLFLISCSGFEYTLDQNSPVESALTTSQTDTNKIPTETKTEVIQSEETFCIESYEPVCGLVEVQCITTPCDPVPQTFSNKCFAEKSKAKDIKEGACES